MSPFSRKITWKPEIVFFYNETKVGVDVLMFLIKCEDATLWKQEADSGQSIFLFNRHGTHK